MIKRILKKIISAFLLLIMVCSCSNYDYFNWKEVEIPTDTPVRCKIKIPNEWEFISEDGIVTLINQANNAIVAEQVYQEFKFDGWHGQIRVDNWDDLEFRTNIDDVDYKNKDNYDRVKINSSGGLVFSFNDGEIERLCLNMKIYSDLSDPACDPETGEKFGQFFLFLMFDELIEFDTIQQMAVSYSWGGTIN